MELFPSHKCNFKPCQLSGRLIPIFGPISNTFGTVDKTPNLRRFPLLGEVIAMVTMNTIQQVQLTIQPVDAKGHPAKLDGAPSWLTDNSDAVSLDVSADGLSCTVKAVGVPGVANVQVKGDADLGTGVTPLVGTIPFTIVQAPAVSIVINNADPVNQP